MGLNRNHNNSSLGVLIHSRNPSGIHKGSLGIPEKSSGTLKNYIGILKGSFSKDLGLALVELLMILAWFGFVGKPEPTKTKPELRRNRPPEPTRTQPEPTRAKPEPTRNTPVPTKAKPEPTKTRPESARTKKKQNPDP